jgi:hypothetical protein
MAVKAKEIVKKTGKSNSRVSNILNRQFKFEVRKDAQKRPR